MRILVPTDFSKTADNALQFAIDHFPGPGTTIILYHSFMPFESGFYSFKKSAEENKAEESHLRNLLIRKANEFSINNSNVQIEVFVDRGEEVRSIHRFADNNDINLIVMGTTGATGIREKLVGSVASGIISKSRIPVIAVPESHVRSDLKNIAFCSNFQMNDIGNLRYLKEILKASVPDIHIWHFYGKGAQSGSELKMSDDYKNIVNNTLGDKQITFHFSETENIEHSLEKLSGGEQLDMLVLMTHRRKGLFNNLMDKSLTQSVVFHTKVPLLAIPAQLN